LTGSGFVLSVPVFFDTVFYLLVPLARSLWKQTRKNYMLYILAIATGGICTHTMVPPTPGPLVMAATLNIDIGVMIIVGSLIALPMAFVGLVTSHVMNRLMDVPVRPYDGESQLEPLEDSKLPALWISLLPVVLPVVLISINTVTKTVADAEHAALVRQGDIEDWPGFCAALCAEQAGLPARRVTELMPAEIVAMVQDTARSGRLTPEQAVILRDALNEVVKSRDFYREEVFVGKVSPGPAREFAARGTKRLAAVEVERFNRLLLETVFAEEINEHVWETPRRKAANLTALLGNANLALLISAAIAMAVLVRQRGLTLKQLAQSTENALMSGGVIILITAGGGAFGAMLGEAGVGGAIEQMISTAGQSAGLLILCVGFGVASVMKIAQGSGTVSMITTSAMLAAVGISPELLGCHPVYLATAIGAGSVCGSWMNDSGFWIFARMSGLTEVETLKSWTILLIVCGIAGMGFTLLFAWLMPLV